VSGNLEKKEWEYQKDLALIVPYVPKLTSASFREEFLVGLYAQTKEEGLLRRVFPGISDKDINLNWFVSYFYSRSLLIGMLKPDQVAGYSWIYETEGDEQFKKGSVGVCFFRKYWGTILIHDLARLGLKWYFQEAGLNVVFGSVAHWNRSSARYAKVMGFEQCARIPMFFWQNKNQHDMDLFVLKREDFFGRRT
jgi:RimJ/RimL family protein N-acetyltransferase